MAIIKTFTTDDKKAYLISGPHRFVYFLGWIVIILWVVGFIMESILTGLENL